MHDVDDLDAQPARTFFAYSSAFKPYFLTFRSVELSPSHFVSCFSSLCQKLLIHHLITTMASATGVPENNLADEQAPLLGDAQTTTQSSQQGLQFNLVTGTAIIAQAGIWILAALVRCSHLLDSIITDKSQVWAAVFEHEVIFFDVHPLSNSAGLFFLAQGTLILQPTASQKQKIQGTYVHSALNLVGVAALISGLVNIEINKASHPESRFTSIHGIMGLVTYILIFIQAFVGFAQFYMPELVFGSVDKAKSVYKYHRWSGYIILLMMLATVCAATQTGFNKNVLHIRLWAVLVACVLIIAGVAPRIKKSKLGL